MRKVLSILLFVSFSHLAIGQGSEMINNGNFVDGSNWSAGAGWTISGGVASYDASTIGVLAQSNANMVSFIEPSTTYTLRFYINVPTGIPLIRIMSSDVIFYVDGSIYTNNGRNEFQFTTPSNIGTGGLNFYTYTDAAFTIDSISLVRNATVGDDPYYVAPDGDNAAAGSIDHPWATWQKAFNIAEPGDTIYFRGGVYYATVPPSIDAYYGDQNSGEIDNWIYYLNYPGETPILDLRLIDRTVQWTGLSINWATYIYFKGLTVRNMYQRYEGSLTLSAWGMAGTSNIIVENCTVYNIGGRGFAYYGYFGEHDEANPMVPDVPYDTTRFINCDAYLCQDSLFNGGIDGGSAVGGFGDGFKGSTHLGGYLSYEGCRAWDCSDDGFDPNWQGFINISNCWSFRNGRWDGDGYGYKIASWEYVNVDSMQITDVLLRTFYNNISAFNSQGPGLGPTFGIGRPVYRANFYNNTFFRNRYGLDFSFDIYPGTDTIDVLIRNNIFYDNLNNDIVDSYGIGTYTYNNLQGTYPYSVIINVTDDDFVLTDSITGITQMSAARKSDGSLPDITFLKLASGSDLIDAGVNVDLPYYGSAPDLGYSESAPIIADHTVVDRYDDIPEYYIDEVKKMWLVIAGESHSYAYMSGLLGLKAVDADYDVSVMLESGTPETPTTVRLRASRATWGDYSNASGWIYSYGEEDWWTNSTAVNRTKAGLTYANSIGNPVSAMGFGWCWDPQAGNPSSADPVTGNRWYGWSVGSPEGPDRAWGLDDADNSLTGNSVNMDNYLEATQAYIDHCDDNAIPTKVFFTTGPVDKIDIGTSDEGMYNAYLKYEHIRDYVSTDGTLALFDYADILSYNNSDALATLTWSGHTFPTIHSDNIGGTATGHIGSVGALRLAKAMWWMLARIAGWDGLSTTVPEFSTATDITSFTLAAQTGAATINATAHTVAIEVAYGTSLTSLSPAITVSYGASIDPPGGTARNFTSPVTYTVTAEDETTTQVWTVTVTVDSAPATSGTVVLDGDWVVHEGKIVKI